MKTRILKGYWDKYLTKKDEKIKDDHLPKKYYDIIKDDIALKNFRDFSQVYYWHITKNGNATRIKYTDLRYLNDKGHYTFNVVFDINDDGSYKRHVGWVFNQPALERKIARAEIRGKK